MATSTLWHDGIYQLLLGILCRLSFHAVTGSWCATPKEYLLNSSVKYLGLSDMFFFRMFPYCIHSSFLLLEVLLVTMFHLCLFFILY